MIGCDSWKKIQNIHQPCEWCSDWCDVIFSMTADHRIFNKYWYLYLDADDISQLHLDHLDLHISIQRVQGIPIKMSHNVYCEIVLPLFLEHSIVKQEHVSVKGYAGGVYHFSCHQYFWVIISCSWSHGMIWYSCICDM